MDPEMLREGEKVAAPDAWKADQEQDAKRRELIGEWRQHLSAKQRKALEEEGTPVGFKSHMSVELVKALTSDEREELAAHEEAEYRRFAPLAEARRTQRLAYVQAGGDEAEFDEMWEAAGRQMTIAEIAAGEGVEHSPERFSSPY